MKNSFIPKSIILQSNFKDEEYMLETSSENWSISLDGISFNINWNEFDYSEKLKISLKNFVINWLQTRSLSTVKNGVYSLLHVLNKSNIDYPYEYEEILKLFVKVNEYSAISNFKSFYKFGLNRNYDGFSSEVLQKIKEFKVYRENPYDKIFLRQNFVSDSDLEKIKKEIIDKGDFEDYESLMANIIVHLAYELAPRRRQLCSINIGDFKMVKNGSNRFYSLNLQMSKKRSTKKIEKRFRKISEVLGEKIQSLLSLHPDRNFKDGSPLFLSKMGNRVNAPYVASIFKSEISRIGLSLTLTSMRHNLAQSLADQGASAEIIAEIMGHNSTFPARAYISATPKIADIKASALGKNRKYSKLIEMFTTGTFIEESDVDEERWVKGGIGNQFIGGIGACGLPENTICPKNPVYSCYTCTKFHPFKKGSHEQVKIGLQKEVQKFIDQAEKTGQLQYNRAVTQLEETIAAVDCIIDKISQHE